MNYEIPASVQAAARRGLELRKEYGRGGTSIGLQTARRLAQGGKAPLSFLRRVSLYFPRHQGDRLDLDGRGGREVSNGCIAWLLWGGDPGRRWSEGIMKKITRSRRAAPRRMARKAAVRKTTRRRTRRNPYAIPISTRALQTLVSRGGVFPVSSYQEARDRAARLEEETGNIYSVFTSGGKYGYIPSSVLTRTPNPNMSTREGWNSSTPDEKRQALIQQREKYQRELDVMRQRSRSGRMLVGSPTWKRIQRDMESKEMAIRWIGEQLGHLDKGYDLNVRNPEGSFVGLENQSGHPLGLAEATSLWLNRRGAVYAVFQTPSGNSIRRSLGHPHEHGGTIQRAIREANVGSSQNPFTSGRVVERVIVKTDGPYTSRLVGAKTGQRLWAGGQPDTERLGAEINTVVDRLESGDYQLVESARDSQSMYGIAPWHVMRGQRSYGSGATPMDAVIIAAKTLLGWSVRNPESNPEGGEEMGEQYYVRVYRDTSAGPIQLQAPDGKEVSLKDWYAVEGVGPRGSFKAKIHGYEEAVRDAYQTQANWKARGYQMEVYDETEGGSGSRMVNPHYEHQAYYSDLEPKEEAERLRQLYYNSGTRMGAEANFMSAESAWSKTFGSEDWAWRVDKRVPFTRDDAREAFIRGYVSTFKGYRVQNPSSVRVFSMSEIRQLPWRTGTFQKLPIARKRGQEWSKKYGSELEVVLVQDSRGKKVAYTLARVSDLQALDGLTGGGEVEGVENPSTAPVGDASYWRKRGAAAAAAGATANEAWTNFLRLYGYYDSRHEEDNKADPRWHSLKRWFMEGFHQGQRTSNPAGPSWPTASLNVDSNSSKRDWLLAAEEAGYHWATSGAADESGVSNASVVRYGFIKWSNEFSPNTQRPPRGVTKPILTAMFRKGYKQGQQSGRRRNPESQAAEFFEVFHGEPSKEEVVITTDIHTHDHLTALGRLQEIKVKTLTGRELVMNWKGEGDDVPYLSSSEDGRQLFIEGGNQTIDLAKIGMAGKEWLRDSMVIGELVEVTYRTRKKFHQFKLTDYYHKLGEETKVKPSLIYDSRSGLMSIAGGQYSVEDVGIKN